MSDPNEPKSSPPAVEVTAPSQSPPTALKNRSDSRVRFNVNSEETADESVGLSLGIDNSLLSTNYGSPVDQYQMLRRASSLASNPPPGEPQSEAFPIPPKPLFTELMEYMQDSAKHDDVWLETARWVRFEEKVEEGSRRWSKPHIATPGLISLLQLSSCMLEGSILLNLNGTSLPHVVDAILDDLERTQTINHEQHDACRELLLRPKKHQYDQLALHKRKQRPVIKVDEEPKHVATESKEIRKTLSQRYPTHHATLDLEKEIFNRNPKFYAKLPRGSEAVCALVGEAPFLQRHVSGFVRLQHALMLPEITEVPVPCRFIFVLLGPVGHSGHYREIGRALGTLMSDENFAAVPYGCRNKDELIIGLDEFLDRTTVLPPGSWNPEIRIEPQSSVLKKPDEDDDDDTVKHETGHANDPMLERSGRLFGGLIADIKRKAPHYVSDFTDAIHMQSLATFLFMYFAVLAPVVTFGGLLEEATGQRLAAIENVLAACFCGVTWHLFCGQPLTILGSTGPVLVFETLVFQMCKTMELEYLPFRFWINAWMALVLMLIVAFDGSTIIKYVTRFTEESFATLIALIFIIASFQKLDYLRAYAYQVTTYTTNATAQAFCNCVPPANASQNSSDYAWFPAVAKQFRWSPLILSEKAWYVSDINGSFEYIDYSHVNLDDCEKLAGELTGEGCYRSYNVFFMSVVLTLGTYIIATVLKKMRTSFFFPSWARNILSDFAITWAIASMVGLDVLVGINTPKLNVPSELRPTYAGRGTSWLVNPFETPYWAMAFAAAPASLISILIFMDQQITGIIVNRAENKLKKGGGYHLDLFVLSFQVLFVGLFGFPVFVAATVRSMNHVNSLKQISQANVPGEIPTMTGCLEQRVTGVLTFSCIGLSVFLTPVLKYIPMPVLYGVFLYMGISALDGIQLTDRLLLTLMPSKYQPDYAYLRHVSVSRVHFFTFIQVICLVGLWVVKSIGPIAIAFPLMLIVMVIVRSMLGLVFTNEELEHLDDELPEMFVRRKEDELMRERIHKEGTVLELGGLRPVVSAANMQIVASQVDMAYRAKGLAGEQLTVPVKDSPPKYNGDDHRQQPMDDLLKSGHATELAKTNKFPWSESPAKDPPPFGVRLRPTSAAPGDDAAQQPLVDSTDLDDRRRTAPPPVSLKPKRQQQPEPSPRSDQH